MEHHVSWLTHLVNQILGAPALALLKALHIKPSYPDTPIPEHVVMALTVLVVGTVLALLLRARLSVERPGASQQIAELLLTNPMGFGINDVLEENAGHDWKKYVPMVGTVALFILLANLFSGPVAWLSPLMFPVEIISTTARLLSLTVRLWANIFASDLIYGLFLGLFTGLAVWAGTKSAIAGIVLGVFPALAPIAFIILHVFVSVVQTYVFAILPAVYIGLATADEH